MSGEVELKQHMGRTIGTVTEINLRQYIVIYKGKRVGYKSWTEGSPIRFVTRLSQEEKDEVAQAIYDLLGDDADQGNLVGIWPHEEEEEIKGETTDDIFDT